MPLGHNRQPPEFGKIVPDNCPSEPFQRPAGFGPAVLLSLGLHVLAGILFWHGLVGSEREERADTRVIDTRVRERGLEVEVCLKLVDSPSPSRKKGDSKTFSVSKASSRIETELAAPTRSDEPSAFRVAGADSKGSGVLFRPPPRGLFYSVLLNSRRPEKDSRPLPGPPEQGLLRENSGAKGPSAGSGILAERGNGNGGATRFFQIGARAKSVVYVIDRSVSMGLNGGLTRAKQELLASLGGMPDDRRFQIIIFNRSVQMLEPESAGGLLAASSENKQKAAEFLASVQPEGGTHPVPALRRALALKPDVIFFLSDAGDWTSRQVQEVTLINRGHTVIHVVDFDAADKDQLNAPLHVLARSNQGEYRAVLLGGKGHLQFRGN